jgi:hypothetical protein
MFDRFPRPKPLRVGTTPGERRRNRLTPPPCSACGGNRTHVASRTDYYLYVRCEECGSVWSVPKPGHERFGT